MIFDRLDEQDGGGGFDGSYCPENYRRHPSTVPGYTPVPAFDRYADEEARDKANAARLAKKPKPSPAAMLWLKDTP